MYSERKRKENYMTEPQNIHYVAMVYLYSYIYLNGQPLYFFSINCCYRFYIKISWQKIQHFSTSTKVSYTLHFLLGFLYSIKSADHLHKDIEYEIGTHYLKSTRKPANYDSVGSTNLHHKRHALNTISF